MPDEFKKREERRFIVKYDFKREYYQFCPLCGSKLRDRTLIDIFSQGFVCLKYHYWYAWKRKVDWAHVDKNWLKLRYDAANPLDIVEGWLIDEKLRVNLPEDTAECLRQIMEFHTMKVRRKNKEDFKTPFCFRCGKKTNRTNFANDYFGCFKCENDHHFASSDKRVALEIEIDERSEILRYEMEFETRRESLKDAVGYLNQLSHHLGAVPDQIKKIISYLY